MRLLDVRFEEGADIFPDEYRTTLGILKLPFKIPKFTIEKKDFLDKVLHIAQHKDIDYIVYEDAIDDYIVKVDDIDEMKGFLSERLKVLIEISGIHHLESNGEAILIMSKNLALAQVKDYIRMIQFVENVKDMLKQKR